MKEKKTTFRMTFIRAYPEDMTKIGIATKGVPYLFFGKSELIVVNNNLPVKAKNPKEKYSSLSYLDN